MSLSIVMHERFPPEDVQAAQRVAAEFDPDAEVRASYGTKALEPVTLVLFIAGAFVSGYLAKAGSDAWDGTVRLVKRLRAEMKHEATFVLDGERDYGIQIIIGPQTPAEALLELPDDVREAAGESGQLFWNEDERRWKAPF
jgi:hypothetical protein